MKNYQNIAATPEVHRRYKLFAARLGIPITEVARRAIALLEAQNELPHPTDGAGVPIIFVEKKDG